MKRSLSLRLRLTLIILVPLLCLGIIAGVWQIASARQTATEVFDRSLLSAALAVANDVAISGGDALSPRTQSILADTSGGQVFYHVYAPDGVIVAGYATPPVGIPSTLAQPAEPTYFEAIYLGRNVHGVRLQLRTEVDGFTGIFTTTVWQAQSVRQAFVTDLVLQVFTIILGLVLALGLIVWFGVHLGLRPLLDLEEAIRRRSSHELSPIRRAVPDEVAGIVNTLNSLFRQVSGSMSAQAEFISNAAHQLRNPIAGVLSLAEAVNSAPTDAEARKRSEDLLEAARETANLSQKLLMYERAKSLNPGSQFEKIDVGKTLRDWIPDLRNALPDHVNFTSTVPETLGTLECDTTMLREALRNLVDNAARHGGAELSAVAFDATHNDQTLFLRVTDDGAGVKEGNLEDIFDRFRQVSTSSGSGLGLSIVRAFADGHGGNVTAKSASNGLSVTISLPLLGD